MPVSPLGPSVNDRSTLQRLSRGRLWIVLKIDGPRPTGTIGESGDVNLESWTCIEGMISTAIKTGHSTYYIAQDLSARGSLAASLSL